MRIALYNETPGELKALAGQLDRCAREYLRFAEIVPYARQEDFCSMVRDLSKHRELGTIHFSKYQEGIL